ncbi:MULTISPECIES: hypothetical protein [unclassified Arcicella]|uniref:hypothetical protein n=1 Tax=unclassified Arcicella TaxID=2644986 RepID=UPI00286288C0|nr:MULTISPECIES: hypothetical protein [unclassified Arcicella]MDR6560197.1 hypothetical protein [Arcicella sp. BE51]MDR6810196.1 hypothetical protein [Arcicella sp. BE140]MDR6821546.1 hypothetical protein [Arcicella sp. BE139]
MENQQKHSTKKKEALSKVEKNGGETPNKVIVEEEEKTWDGPLGEAVRHANSPQIYAVPKAIPRTTTIETGNQKPLSNPDEARPQTQKPTVIQQPVANDDEKPSSEEVKKQSIEHSEKNNVSDKRGYNELKTKKE